jgi:hypothetical protein
MENEPKFESASPLPHKVEVVEIKDAEVEKVVMTFTEAIEAILKEQKVTRDEWDDKEAYGYLKDGFLMIKKSEDKKDYQWIVSEADMKAEDWIIV